ncbi:hypothetical protein [Undibacterium sp. Tian12W]|uniref:hypothetical protein n=1 Tax=Undibacterium sp. Tian12W TaxID=3413054 RepID=UPI003BF3388C
MEDLQLISKYLEEKGLLISQCSANYIQVSKSGDATISLKITDSRFNLGRWDYTPGPGENDFSIDIDTLDEATLIIWNYFLAQPTTIAGWNIDLHRYPYWSLAQMQYRLTNLVHVTEEQFEAIKDERQKRFDRTSLEYLSRNDIAEKMQFIDCGKNLASGEKLKIRRDMQEAYAIHAT